MTLAPLGSRWEQLSGNSWVKSGWSRGRPPSNRPKRLVAGDFRGRHIDESLTSLTPSYCRAGSTAEQRSRRREGEVFRRPSTRHAGLAEGSVSDTAGETALPVIRFRCLHLGLSGWRSLSAKTRVNLA